MTKLHNDSSTSEHDLELVKRSLGIRIMLLERSYGYSYIKKCFYIPSRLDAALFESMIIICQELLSISNSNFGLLDDLFFNLFGLITGAAIRAKINMSDRAPYESMARLVEVLVDTSKYTIKSSARIVKYHQLALANIFFCSVEYVSLPSIAEIRAEIIGEKAIKEFVFKTRCRDKFVQGEGENRSGLVLEVDEIEQFRDEITNQKDNQSLQESS